MQPGAANLDEFHRDGDAIERRLILSPRAMQAGSGLPAIDDLKSAQGADG